LAFKQLVRAALRPLRKANVDPLARLNLEKLNLIDFACTELGVKSFADLGGVWNVDGGYTFYALDKHPIDRAFLVDTDFNEAVLQRRTQYPQLQTIQGNFGDERVAQQIGQVGAVFFFDTLLHQVKPDWDNVLEMYARRADCFIIYNQQFVNAAHTVRLLDLGEAEYFKNVPHRPSEEPYTTLFQKLDEINPQHQRPWRDVHNIWQWGIVDADLERKMRQLGFAQRYYKNCGRFGNLPNFEEHAFIFQRTEQHS
jgi:hypothetical protein